MGIIIDYRHPVYFPAQLEPPASPLEIAKRFSRLARRKSQDVGDGQGCQSIAHVVLARYLQGSGGQFGVVEEGIEIKPAALVETQFAPSVIRTRPAEPALQAVGQCPVSLPG